MVSDRSSEVSEQLWVPLCGTGLVKIRFSVSETVILLLRNSESEARWENGQIRIQPAWDAHLDRRAILLYP